MISILLLNYWVAMILIALGIFIVISKSNLIKKIVGLGIFQTAVYLLYISPGKIIGGTLLILADSFSTYSNPLPHVLILTAIVVGVATSALGLSIIIRIKEEFGTIEEDEIENLFPRKKNNMSFFISQIPALIVSVPLFCAPFCIISNHKFFSWLIALIATFFSFICSIFLFLNIQEKMVISYAMGQWLAPWGIEFRIDKLNSFLILIVSFFALYACFFGLRSLKNDIEESKISLFWTSYLLCISGLLGVLITGDAFNIFVFLEISSLATYIIIGLGRDKKALYASFQYLILGTMGATFIVIAIGLLYVSTGTLNLFDLSFRVKNIVDNPALITAIAFLFVGISLKAAIFPLHTWLPNAYSYSPNVTTIFLSATATKVAIYLFFRFGYDIFGPSDIISTLSIGKIIIFLSLLAILFGF